MIRSSTALTAAGLALPAAMMLAACTEDPLTGIEEGSLPGTSVDTREVLLRADELPLWRDTTLSGFALPGDADFVIASERSGLRSRSLVRFEELPDSVAVGDSADDRAEIDEFVSAKLRIFYDTTASIVPAEGFTLRVRALERKFVDGEATWERAAEGRPWSTPGGDFGPELGVATAEPDSDGVVPDSVAVTFETDVDSLLTDWRSTRGGNGIGFLVDEGARLQITDAALDTDVRPVDRDTVISLTLSRQVAFFPATFIFDPPAPDPGLRLRAAGLPSHRFYMEFTPPETVDGIELRKSTINRAELLFTPVEPTSESFRLLRPARGATVELEGDPFVTGAKTPIGPPLSGASFQLDPDSLGTGRPLRIPVTNLMVRWAGAPPDSIDVLRLGVRMTPDAQGLGFWEFGSVEEAAAGRPVLRMLITPPAPFDIP